MAAKAFKLLPVSRADHFTYALSFMLVFDGFFLPRIAGGSSETTGMFFVFSLLATLLFILFPLLLNYFTGNILLQHILGYCVLMLIVSEIGAGLALGQPALFGVFQQPVVYDGTAYPETYTFRKQAGFGLSMSFLVSAVICLVRKVLASFIAGSRPLPKR